MSDSFIDNEGRKLQYAESAEMPFTEMGFSARKQQELFGGTNKQSEPHDIHQEPESKSQAAHVVQQQEITEEQIPDDAQTKEEIHAVAGKIIEGTGLEAEIAQREYVYNEDGDVTDVLFTQGEKSLSLKGKLPGSYTIIVTHFTEDEAMRRRKNGEHINFYDPLTDIVIINEPPEKEDTNGELNLSLLHEAGHAVDEYENKAIYEKLRSDNTIAEIQRLMAEYKRDAIKNNKLDKFDPKLYDWWMKKQKHEFSPEIYAQMDVEFKSFMSELEAEAAVDNLIKLGEKYFERERKAEVRLKSLEERRAWANALNVYRNMQHEGVNIFSGTKQEVFDYADDCLASYEKAYKPFLSDDTRFVHVPNKGRV